jgi:hypothetical protein
VQFSKSHLVKRVLVFVYFPMLIIILPSNPKQALSVMVYLPREIVLVILEHLPPVVLPARLPSPHT